MASALLRSIEPSQGSYVLLRTTRWRSRATNGFGDIIDVRFRIGDRIFEPIERPGIRPLRSIPELAERIRYIAGSGLLLGANMSSSRSGVPSTRCSDG